jgi:hypothetical protein
MIAGGERSLATRTTFEFTFRQPNDRLRRDRCAGLPPPENDEDGPDDEVRPNSAN